MHAVSDARNQDVSDPQAQARERAPGRSRPGCVSDRGPQPCGGRQRTPPSSMTARARDARQVLTAQDLRMLSCRSRLRSPRRRRQSARATHPRAEDVRRLRLPPQPPSPADEVRQPGVRDVDMRKGSTAHSRRPIPAAIAFARTVDDSTSNAASPSFSHRW
jgi:hypothetical protein